MLDERKGTTFGYGQKRDIYKTFDQDIPGPDRYETTPKTFNGK
jgi:hypothetical protein